MGIMVHSLLWVVHDGAEWARPRGAADSKIKGTSMNS